MDYYKHAMDIAASSLDRGAKAMGVEEIAVCARLAQAAALVATAAVQRDASDAAVKTMNRLEEEGYR